MRAVSRRLRERRTNRCKENKIKMDKIYINGTEFPITAFEYSRGKNLESVDQSDYDIVRIRFPDLVSQEIFAEIKENGFTYGTQTYNGYSDMWGCDITIAKKVSVDDKLKAAKDEINNIYGVLEGKNTASPGSILGVLRYILDDFITRAAADGKNMAPYMPVIKEWAPDTRYMEGDICKYGGMLFRCKTAHTSKATNPKDDAKNWAGPYGTTIKYD